MPINEDAWEQKVISALQKVGWQYVPAEQLDRTYGDVMVETLVKEALIRLNPAIEAEPSKADIVIQRLRVYFSEAASHNLIDINERFRSFVLDKNSFNIGENGRSIPVDIFGTITKGNTDKNSYIVTNQWVYPQAEGGKRLDIVLLVNGIPFIIGELKTPVKESITYLDAIKDINDYEKSVPKMFTANVLNFATEGKCFRYGSIKSSVEHWGPWFKYDHKKEGTIEDVLTSIQDMLVPEKVIKLVIVTSKLLTGFDAPVLQVMYLDKPMKNHSLLQAVCRTNRVYGHEKTYGLIVDYAWLKAQITGKVVELCCAIGDETVDGRPYAEIVEIARNYINTVGGFEKFAEWGLV